MEGTLEVTYAVSERVLKVEDVLEAGGGEAEGDGKELWVTGVTRDGDLLKVSFTLEKGRDPGLTEQTESELKRYGFLLEDPAGKRHKTTGISGPDLRGGTGGGVIREGTALFRVEGETKGKWSLVYAYPGRMVKKVYRVKIEGVPAP